MRLLMLLALVGCSGGSDDAPSGNDTGDTGEVQLTPCEQAGRATCIEVEAGDVQGLLDAANLLEADTALVLPEGTFTMNNALTIRTASVTLLGAGMGSTILDFGEVANQVNGVDVVGDDFHIEGLTILDAPKDGLRIEDSSDIVIRGVEATWTNEDDPSNGAYGLYPVKVSNVLMEDSVGTNASDAGIYVGQCQHAVVRNNIARGNVAGLEIENTQYADVYGNTVEDNTAGLLIFDLPGNPVPGHDIHVHDNVVQNNNRANFAPGGVVRMIPAGTGTFAMASRRVVITGNTYANNDTTDIALISGLVVEGDLAQWFTPTEDIVGDWEGIGLIEGDGGIYNFRSHDIWVHGNQHSGSGTAPDTSDPALREIGWLLGVLYGATPVDTVFYDTIGESAFDATDPAGNSNDNHICVGADAGVTFASLNLEALVGGLPRLDDVYRPAAPFAPFDCSDVEVTAPTVETP